MATIYIPIKKSKPGMKLAEDIYINNMILCKKDTELTENIIQRLQNMGIETIPVEQKLSDEETKALLEEKLKLINLAFKDRKGDCIEMLKNALVGFWKRKLSDG